MKALEQSNCDTRLHSLCEKVRYYSGLQEYPTCYELITDAIANNPNSPAPHNLLGILLEKKGNHALAMRHFRAAWALDPTYLPARQNLEKFGTFRSNCRIAFDEADCDKGKEIEYDVVYDDKGIGHVVRRNQE